MSPLRLLVLLIRRHWYNANYKCVERVTHWGTSPKFLNAIMHDLKGALPPLTSLQATLTSGSALSTETFEWFYNIFPKRVALQNGSGGTDMLGGSEYTRLDCRAYLLIYDVQLSVATT